MTNGGSPAERTALAAVNELVAGNCVERCDVGAAVPWAERKTASSAFLNFDRVPQAVDSAASGRRSGDVQWAQRRRPAGVAATFGGWGEWRAT